MHLRFGVVEHYVTHQFVAVAFGVVDACDADPRNGALEFVSYLPVYTFLFTLKLNTNKPGYRKIFDAICYHI